MKKITEVFESLFMKITHHDQFALNKPDEGLSRYQDAAIKAGMLLILLIFLSIIYPSGVSFKYSDLKVGMVSREQIIAPFTFPILKTISELNEDRNHVMQTVPDVFDKDSRKMDMELTKVHALFSEIKKVYKDHSDKIKPLLKQDSIDISTVSDFDTLLFNWRIKYEIILNRKNLFALFDLSRDRKINNLEQFLLKYLKRVYQKGIINVPRYKLVSDKISVVTDSMEVQINEGDFYSQSEARGYIKRSGSEVFKDSRIVSSIIPFAEAFCRPNMYYNIKLTESRRQEEINNVPVSKGFVYKDQLIVDKGDIITPETYNILQSLTKEQAKKGIVAADIRVILFGVGKYIINLILLVILVLYLAVYRSRTFKNNYHLFLIFIIFILQFGINYLFVRVLNWNPLSMPIMLLPMMIGMLLDSGTAFAATFVSAFITAAMLGMDISFAFYTVSAGIASIYATRRMRKRSDSIRAMAIVFLVYAATFLALGFLRFEPFIELSRKLIIPFIATAGFMFIAYMLILVFEKIFDLTTDITLLELSDLNNPLLKKLSVESPGTFHHSLIMGNLAEAAAERIKANPLLARVGCYYHDIGKMEMPEYFVENQMGAMNRHESLQPNMSAIILANHVKKGLDLADKYNLPTAVKQFIPEHHGTSRMEYFYHKAREVAGEQEIDDSDYRYPGPKPQKKETAIAMLADNIEAAARSLKNPSPGKIRQLVNEMVNKKFEEGELEECDLTLKDLQTIKEAFIPILLGIHHHRIEYPGQKKDSEADDAVKTENESDETPAQNDNAPVLPSSGNDTSKPQKEGGSHAD